MSDGPAAQPLYFFLSYARADSGDDPYLEKFYRELSVEVRARAGALDARTVGFFDLRTIEPGQSWSTEIGAALARCRTFIAMCSPTFFTSEYCGREWAAFDERLRAAADGGHDSPAALLPVIWTPLPETPQVLARLQYDHGELGKVYAGNGLRYLMQLDRNRDEYQDFLVALSTRIVQLAHGSPLLPRKEILSLEQAPNAFRVVTTVPPVLPAPPERPALPTSSPAGGAAWPARRDLPEFPARPAPPGPPTPPESTGEAAAEAATESQGGPRRVTFVLAAASAGEIAALRQQLDFYGDDFDEWTPYRPHHRDRVCVIAQMVAAQQGMTSRIKRLDGGISDLLESSTARNEIVVLLVDMWAAKLDEFRLALSAYDRRNEPTSGVLVPFNPDDAETHDNVQHLRETLAEALRKNFTRRDKLFRMDVRTREEFDRALVQIIVDSQARIFDLQRVFRPLGETRRPPRLYGP